MRAQGAGGRERGRKRGGWEGGPASLCERLAPLTGTPRTFSVALATPRTPVTRTPRTSQAEKTFKDAHLIVQTEVGGPV